MRLGNRTTGVNLKSSFLVGWVERIGPGDPPLKNNTSPAQVPTLPKIESETQRSLLTLANILAYKVGFRSIFEVLCRCIVLRCAWVCVLPLLIRSTQPTGLHTKLTLMMRFGNRTYRVWKNIALPNYFLKLHETAPTGGGKCPFIFWIHYKTFQGTLSRVLSPSKD